MLNDKLILNISSNFISFPLAIVTLSSILILFIFIISLYPSKIIILLSFNSSCNTQSIFIWPFPDILENAHLAFSPVTYIKSNSNLVSNVNSVKNSPIIVNIPVTSEFLVSNKVGLNTGIFIGFVL